VLLDIRLTLCGVMLFTSAYFDLKSREIDDKIWWGFSALGLALTAAEVFLGYNPDLLLYLASTMLSGGLGFAFYYLGFYGGADAKALLACALLAPLFNRNHTLHPFTPIIIFVNSVILTTTLIVYYGVSNSTRLLRGERIFEGLEHEPLHRKILACLLGFRAKRRVGSFYFTLERKEAGKRRFDFSLLRVNEDFVTEEGIWVTPGIPLLVFMAAGFVITVVFGDLLRYILEALTTLVKAVS
jgi:preflagellin peptidase FlaK